MKTKVAIGKNALDEALNKEKPSQFQELMSRRFLHWH
jgi:hypothetical protein